MKSLISVFIAAAASFALAWNPDKDMIVDMDLNISRAGYAVHYPNRPPENFSAGQKYPADCVALISEDANEIPLKSMLRLAQSLKVESGLIMKADLTPKIVDGIVLFQPPELFLYVTSISISTRNQRTFSQNKNFILGIKASVKLKYVRHCSGTVI